MLEDLLIVEYIVLLFVIVIWTYFKGHC